MSAPPKEARTRDLCVSSTIISELRLFLPEVCLALIVNGQRIDDSIVQSEFSQIKAYFENLGNVSCCERDDEFRGYARQNVVARALLAQEAIRRNPPVPEAEVEAAVSKLVEEYGGETRFYAATGASAEQMHLVRH